MMKKHQKVSAVMIDKTTSWNQLLNITFEPTIENSNIVKKSFETETRGNNSGNV